MTATLVFLTTGGAVASKPDREQGHCIATTGTFQVGATVTVNVEVKNVGTTVASFVRVQYFLKRSTDPHAVPITGGSQGMSPANPTAPTVIQPGHSTLDTTTLEEFEVNWLLQNGDAGAGTLFAQIQDQGTPPNVEDMTLDCNAKKAIIVLPVTPHVTPPGPAAAVSAADGLEPA